MFKHNIVASGVNFVFNRYAVPAAAVTRDTQRLFGITGLKKLLDGSISLW